MEYSKEQILDSVKQEIRETNEKLGIPGFSKEDHAAIGKISKGLDKLDLKSSSWMQGYACALVNYLNLIGINDTQSDEMFKGGIGSINKAVENGVHPNDIEVLKLYYK